MNRIRPQVKPWENSTVPTTSFSLPFHPVVSPLVCLSVYPPVYLSVSPARWVWAGLWWAAVTLVADGAWNLLNPLSKVWLKNATLIIGWEANIWSWLHWVSFRPWDQSPHKLEATLASRSYPRGVFPVRLLNKVLEEDTGCVWFQASLLYIWIALVTQYSRGGWVVEPERWCVAGPC